jgi:hypothetical protein
MFFVLNLGRTYYKILGLTFTKLIIDGNFYDPQCRQVLIGKINL